MSPHDLEFIIEFRYPRLKRGLIPFSHWEKVVEVRMTGIINFRELLASFIIDHYNINRYFLLMKLSIILFVFVPTLCLCARVPVVIETGGKELPDFKDKVERAVGSFSERFSVRASEIDTIRIVVTYTRAEFEEATSGAIPDWGVGAAIPARNEIVVLFSESSKSPRAVELIAHELGHIVLYKATGEVRVPRWFDEGFAQWVSGGMDFQQSSRIALANLLGENLNLRELEDLNSWDSERANLAYAESRAAFEFLIEILPDNGPEKLIELIRKNGGFDKGIEAASGLSLTEFYILWANERSGRFGWSLLLADWRVSFSIITLLFLVLGGIKLARIRMANRKSEIRDEEIQA